MPKTASPEIFERFKIGCEWWNDRELDLMQEWCATMTKAELLAALEAAKMPSAPLYSTRDALDDPHVQAMGYLEKVPFPGAARPVPIIETPFRMMGGSVPPLRCRVTPVSLWRSSS